MARCLTSSPSNGPSSKYISSKSNSLSLSSSRRWTWSADEILPFSDYLVLLLVASDPSHVLSQDLSQGVCTLDATGNAVGN
eukprot:3167759-Amphidinium_carterae.2